MKMTLDFMKKNVVLIAVFLVLCLLLIEPSFATTAWDDKLKTFLTAFKDTLIGVGGAVITIAIIFVGYQIAFGGKTISSLMPIIIGAIVIGGAAAFAGLLLP